MMIASALSRNPLGMHLCELLLFRMRDLHSFRRAKKSEKESEPKGWWIASSISTALISSGIRYCLCETVLAYEAKYLICVPLGLPTTCVTRRKISQRFATYRIKPSSIAVTGLVAFWIKMNRQRTAMILREKTLTMAAIHSPPRHHRCGHYCFDYN